MALRLFYTDHHQFPLPAGHKFPLLKYRLLREALAREPGFDLSPAPLATAEQIEAIHSPAYVQKFLDGSVTAAVMRRIGFPWSPELVTRTLASVGGTLAAASAALQHGIAGTLAGGTHHAFRDEGSGFCVFNDLAVAIHALRTQGVHRISVIDLDVHQGDGTAKLFEHDPHVLTISVHGRNNFPFRKQTSKVDIDLADGAGDTEYLNAVREAVVAAFDFQPDVVFFQAGVDALASDKLGKLSVSAEGMQERDRLVLSACRAARVPSTITLGGGYSEPIEHTVHAHARTFRLARDLYFP